MTSLPLTLSSRPTFSAPRFALAEKYFKLFCLILLGYAIGGRGFAYLGLPPIFVGELAFGLGVMVFLISRSWLRVIQLPQSLVLFPFIGWGLARTIPYFDVDGMAALRDAVIWGYAIFAFIAAALIMDEPSRLAKMIVWYRKFIPIFLVGILIVFVLGHFGPTSRPKWPWADVEILNCKEGDMLVHLAGVLGFWMAGLGGAFSSWWIVLMTANVCVMGVIDRAGLLSFLAVLGLCIVLAPRGKVPGRLIGTIICGIAILWMTSIRLEIPDGKGRELSFEQVMVNLKSMTGDSGSNDLEGTKDWRLDWWNAIVDYTVHGEYFWTGKGFGVNLADDDGFQVTADHALRSPHNIHMSVLARTGVPGIVMWSLIHVTWGISIFRAFLHSWRRRVKPWPGLFLFLLAFWSAFLINGSFDVFIEGPMGGIWFWAIYGVGAASVWVYRKHPEALTRAPELA